MRATCLSEYGRDLFSPKCRPDKFPTGKERRMTPLFIVSASGMIEGKAASDMLGGTQFEAVKTCRKWVEAFINIDHVTCDIPCLQNKSHISLDILQVCFVHTTQWKKKD